MSEPIHETLRWATISEVELQVSRASAEVLRAMLESNRALRAELTELIEDAAAAASKPEALTNAEIVDLMSGERSPNAVRLDRALGKPPADLEDVELAGILFVAAARPRQGVYFAEAAKRLTKNQVDRHRLSQLIGELITLNRRPPHG